MTTLTIGHTLNLAIQELDQHGNPMLVPVVYDAAPVWTNSSPATETLSVSSDGKTATGTPIAPGTDTVSLSVSIGGQVFTATLAVEVNAAPQVVSSIVIVPTVN
jgi:DMSO reductase anchor subunit